MGQLERGANLLIGQNLLKTMKMKKIGPGYGSKILLCASATGELFWVNGITRNHFGFLE